MPSPRWCVSALVKDSNHQAPYREYMQDAPFFALETIKAAGFPSQCVTVQCNLETGHTSGEVGHLFIEW
jgi:hypothetical protein